MAVLYSSAPFLVMILREIFDNVITECNAPDNSRFRVPSKRQKCPPRVEPGGRQTANAGNVRSRDPLCRSREKNTLCLISLNYQMPGGGDESRGQMPRPKNTTKLAA